jgi:peptidoglycan/xylan/chitin deacetylase (PgdA/CDA1 family)
LASRPVALTFDDGPDPVWTPRVLDALESAGVRATFFVVGARVHDHPDVVRETLARGHSVQPHCWLEHRRHDQMTYAEIARDIELTVDALQVAGVTRVDLWRPPHGIIKRPDSVEVAARHKLTLMGWTADLRDYRAESTCETVLSAAQPLRGPSRVGAALRQLRRRTIPRTLNPGTVFLLHDGRIDAQRTTCESTVGAIGLLTRMVRERGWEFGVLSVDSYPSVVLG